MKEIRRTRLQFCPLALSAALLLSTVEVSLSVDVARSVFPAAERALVLAKGRFRDLQSGREVPSDVLKLCFPHALPADPHKPWNPTDSVTDPSLPFSRIRWLATDDEHWIFCWEHGGIAHSVGFMLIAKTGGIPATTIWDAGRADKELETFAEFQDYVRANGTFAPPSSTRP
jgi:hypothetical protein